MKRLRQLTQQEAYAFAAGGEWKNWTPEQRALFQLRQDRLCMDLSAYHDGLRVLLGRSVFSHEMADPEGLLAEAEGRRGAPTLEQIFALIPPEKLIVVVGP